MPRRVPPHHTDNLTTEDMPAVDVPGGDILGEDILVSLEVSELLVVLHGADAPAADVVELLLPRR